MFGIQSLWQEGWRVIYLAGLIVFINNVIAPLLVLMVYKQGKKKFSIRWQVLLYFIQLVALCYGMWKIEQGRDPLGLYMI